MPFDTLFRTVIGSFTSYAHPQPPAAMEGRGYTTWEQVSTARLLHWLLRLGIACCFIGHGAYGFLTKEVWCQYFAVVGIGREWAYTLMPLVGGMDVALGVMMLVLPIRLIPLHLVIWGLWTGALRPLAGDSVWELVERAGNYGVPLAFLLLSGSVSSLKEWFVPQRSGHVVALTEAVAQRVHWALRVTTGLLLLGHGALGALHQKVGLTQHYASIGLSDVMVGSLTLTQAIGWCEIALACSVLLRPFPALLLVACGWKMATEGLWMTSGSLAFEWIERAGSYVAPLGLYYLMRWQASRGEVVVHERELVSIGS